MKFVAFIAAIASAVAPVLGQTIELGSPQNGDVLQTGQNFTVQVIQPESMASVFQVGISLSIANCNNGVCPQPTQQLGDVLYAGPWTPTAHSPGGFYQNFTFPITSDFVKGPAVFTLSHFCLIGVWHTTLIKKLLWIL
ncbi:hypothetical protein SCLCIDRAFT_1224081, partial [Scleroderma citrinum Foug A]